MDTQIRHCLLKIMTEYLSAKRETSGGHPLGQFVRNDVPKEFLKLPFIDGEKYIVSASVGMGNWAFVPWIAIMNKSVTATTQKGYYIVYLFSENMEMVYLTIGVGVTETPKDEMAKINEEIRELVPASNKIKKDGNIELGESKKAKDYALSTAVYIPYTVDNMPEEEELAADLKEMIEIYENYISIKQRTEYEPSEAPKQTVTEKKEEYISYPSLVGHIHDYILSKGFYYTEDEMKNFFLSLKSKPFVILSGISGTGKTKMVQWFAESVGATEKNGRFALIPVRPDWNDGSDLLGYVDIKGEFKEGPLTKVIKKARENPDLPYFVLLDEMNLARVEYYFSDILSVMESRRWENGEIVSSPLLKEDAPDLTLPNNLYIIGTVNMDETTHPFSKKVLDRANTIEFNRIDLGNLSFLQERKEKEPLSIGNQQFASVYLHLKDAYKHHKQLIEQATDELIKINEALQPIYGHVGYRVRDEICFYLAYNEEANFFSFEKALDYCILQKILPRISGSDSRVEQCLMELYRMFTNQQFDEDSGWDPETARFPLSGEKVFEMLRRLRNDGFTSFWIS